MIIYVVSYPRSGNSWVLNLIEHYFGIDAAWYYSRPSSDHNLRQENKQILGDFFVPYMSSRNDVSGRRLADNCRLILSTDLRKQLAAASDCFVVKTHERPYREYFDNEIVLHVIRHPAASYWSYLNFKSSGNPKSNTTLEEIILGDNFVGSWSSHTGDWLSYGETHPHKYLRITYELLGSQTERVLKQIEALIGFSRLKAVPPFPDFASWNSADPIMYRAGKKSEWKAKFTSKQVALTWMVNGNLMEILGYDFSSFAEKLPTNNMADFCSQYFEKIMSDIGETLNARERFLNDLWEQIKNKDEAIGRLKMLLTELDSKD